MGYPTIADSDTKNGVVTSNSTSWTLTYPTNIAANDLLIAFIATDGGPTGNFTWPSGWVSSGKNAYSSAVNGVVGKKKATGSESGNFTVTNPNSEQGAWRVFRIPAATWEGTLGTDSYFQNNANCGAAVADTGAYGASSTPDPGSLNPASWDTEDTLWFVGIAVDTSRTVSAYPYSGRNTADVSGGSGGATLALCTTTARAASLDPGTFTISNSDDFIGFMVAVRGTSAGTEAPAGNASGTGTAPTAFVSVYAYAGCATGTGTAPQPSGLATRLAPAGLASGTGTSLGPTASPGVQSGPASGTGTAPASITSVSPFAGVASGSGTANDPTVTTFQGTNVDAGLASGTGTAWGPVTSVGVTSSTASGTGTANQPTVSAFVAVNAPAGVATGTGAAEWGGGGGTTTVAQDSFTEAGSGTAALTTHTPETGTAWTLDYSGPAGGMLIDKTNDRVSTPIPPEYSGEDGGGYGVVSPDITGEVDVYLTGDDGYVAGPLVRRVSATTHYRVDAYYTSVRLIRLTSGAYTQIGSTTKSIGSTRVRLNASGVSPTALKVKAWASAGSEPGTWGIDTTDNTAANQNATGKVGIVVQSYDDSEGLIGAAAADDFLATTPGGGGATAGPSVRIGAYPSQASGTGTANQPTPSVRAPGGVASGTGTAHDPTVTTFSGTSANAGVAEGTGSALQPVASLSSMPGVASGTGTANDPTVNTQVQVQVNAGVASGTGTAWGPTPSIVTFAPVTSGTGTAPGPIPSVSVMTEAVSGTGTANQPSVVVAGNVSVYPGVASGIGTAPTATSSVATFAPTSSGTGTAWGVSARVSPAPSPASGTGTSWAPTPSIRVPAGTSSGTGTAWAGTVSSLNLTSAPAGVASGMMVAWAPGIATSTSYGGLGPAGTATNVTSSGTAEVVLDLTGRGTIDDPGGSATFAGPAGRATNVRPT